MFRGIVGPSSVKLSSSVRQKREFRRLSVLPSKCSFRLLTSRANHSIEARYKNQLGRPMESIRGRICALEITLVQARAVPCSVGRRNETRTFCSTSMALFLLEIDRKTHPRLRWSPACARARARARARAFVIGRSISNGAFIGRHNTISYP